MLAIAAAGAFVGLFVLWVVLPRKLLRNKKPRTPRPVRGRVAALSADAGVGPGGEGPETAALSADAGFGPGAN